MKDRNYWRSFNWSKYQRAIFKEVAEGHRNIAVEAVAGSGKCLGRGTKVLMHSGAQVPVEKVQVGDRVMGDDGTARTVLE